MINETQTSPPDFGDARRVPSWWLNLSILRRRSRAKAIVEQSSRENESDAGLISIVVLSCKRQVELQRLTESLMLFLGKIEDYSNVEKILVDNGSEKQLVEWAKSLCFYDSIVAHECNLGMAVALNDIFWKVRGEYILLIEDDFVLDYNHPFFRRCLSLFKEYPEIGIIRLKNQKNWGKRFRIISPLRKTSDGTKFWTWLPSFNGKLNIWTAGSVMFRRVSFTSTGEIPTGPNVDRTSQAHQGILYEEVYGKRYNRNWLAAKIYDCYPFIQPGDNKESPGWAEG